MRLWINGKSSDAPEACRTVADLLTLPEWQGRMVIVELNGQVLAADHHEAAALSEGDRLELVHFVGGG